MWRRLGHSAAVCCPRRKVLIRGFTSNEEAAYKIIGVPPGSTLKEVQAAFHKLALKHHPDVGGSVEQMKKLSIAYKRITKELSELAEIGIYPGGATASQAKDRGSPTGDSAAVSEMDDEEVLATLFRGTQDFLTAARSIEGAHFLRHIMDSDFEHEKFMEWTQANLASLDDFIAFQGVAIAFHFVPRAAYGRKTYADRLTSTKGGEYAHEIIKHEVVPHAQGWAYKWQTWIMGFVFAYTMTRLNRREPRHEPMPATAGGSSLIGIGEQLPCLVNLQNTPFPKGNQLAEIEEKGYYVQPWITWITMASDIPVGISPNKGFVVYNMSRRFPYLPAINKQSWAYKGTVSGKELRDQISKPIIDSPYTKYFTKWSK